MSEDSGAVTRPDRREIALLLPGMTLNGSIFPALPIDTVSVDFTALDTPTIGGMRGYVGLLRDTLNNNGFWGFDRRYVVAHSFGGMLALAWLTEHDEDRQKIDGLILMGTTAGPMLERARLRIVGIGSKAVRVPVSPLLAVWDLPFVTRLMKALTTASMQAHHVDFQRLRFKSDFAVDLAGWRNTHWQAMRSFRAAMRGSDLRSKLINVDIPTLILHGPRDSFFTHDVAKDLADGLPTAELRVVPGAAHLLPLTHGGEVLRAWEELRVGDRR
jgi:pimeloyl-ACP methyl ester carboxylesterase